MKMCMQSDRLHCMTNTERSLLQEHLRKMYVEIEKVCDRHGLIVMGAYGTVLGALRHKGFIPWDDDLDLFMPREDYDKLLHLYAAELPKEYKVFAPNGKNNPIYRFGKVVDTSTKFVMPVSDESQEWSGVFVDIFPLENTPTNKLLIQLRRLWLCFLMYVASSVAQYEDKASLYKELMCGNSEARRNYQFRNLVGQLFSFKKATQWYDCFDRHAQWKKHTGFYSVPSAGYSLKYFIPLKASMYVPVQKITFDGIEMNVPNEAEKHLCMEYGNWQRIPKGDEKWQHFIQKISL